ncbi:MAG: histidine phosphatase family protein [Flavobacteriales bacterium]|nr:histidine phosphatase family protein [Bacteroidota bacterium]MCB9239610.1 histidine phosphatase family protein [Flavobacteriales bacterium]
MKKLLVVRHCKSDWDNPGLPDHDRPLNQRGLNDLPKIASRLTELQPTVEKVFHSTAKRAADTARYIHQNWNPGIPISDKSVLYTFSAHELRYFISTLPDELSAVMIVSHNPGLTDLINDLTRIRLDNLPTGGFCMMEFDVDSWSKIRDRSAEVDFLEYPKMIHNS